MNIRVFLTVAGLAGTVAGIGQMQVAAEDRSNSAPLGGVPDVAVSRVGLQSSGTLDSFAYYGSFGGIRAFAMASTSCNVGTATAQWINSHTGGNAGKHPVIAQNMYRLLDGRFEQIGMSWLKHSFCAVSEPTCGVCQSTNCSTLGIGCADTYSASLNGNQNSLGPRSEINPWPNVGVATHTTYSAPTGNATISGRLQISDDDINAGGQNFAEIQYVTHDEPFDFRHNNASWREVNLSLTLITGVGAGQASVHFQDPVLTAWEQNDPGATFLKIDVPVDGRLYLGYKATDLGGGMWHYEYALQNLNSDRSARLFSLPIPAGVTVTNTGFHDVDYHSGEPYDGTDWPVTIGGGLVEWSTQTEAANPNANALRWGSLYNFRFDADRPPETVSATIGLFKPGTPTDLTVQILGPSASPACPWDLDGDGAVAVPDLLFVLANWGAPYDVADLLALLNDWGPCP